MYDSLYLVPLSRKSGQMRELNILAEEQIENNLRHIAKFSAKPYPEIQNESTVTKGFGSHGPVKLVRRFTL